MTAERQAKAAANPVCQSSGGSMEVSRKDGNERFPNMIILRGTLDSFREFGMSY